MKVYQLSPEDESEWLSPQQVADAFASTFFAVDADVQRAVKLGEEFLQKYRQLLDVCRDTGRSTPLDELERRWNGAMHLTVKIEEKDDEWLQTVALTRAPMELEFSQEVSRRRHRAIARRAADCLGYRLVALDTD